MHLKPAELPEEVASIAAFSHAVECIYDCAFDPARWPSAIREACEATTCMAGVIGVSDLITGSARLQQHWNYGPEWLERMVHYGPEVAEILKSVPDLHTRSLDEPIVVSRDIDQADKLRRVGARPYRIARFCDGWREEEFANASEAIARVMALADGARAAARAGDFLQSGRRRQDLAPTDPLRLLFEAWSSGMRGAEMLTTVANELFNGRYIVAEADGASDDLCIVTQDRDFNLIGQNWMSRVPRLRIADWPDVAYGRWVEQSYRRAWQGVEPLIDNLDCFIQWPQLGKRRHRYARLILPCRSASGSPRLLGAMRFDRSIDL